MKNSNQCENCSKENKQSNKKNAACHLKKFKVSDEQINKLMSNLRKVNLSIIEKYVSKDLLKDSRTISELDLSNR